MNELCCPCCGSTYLHQTFVTVHCAAEGQSLSITFWCEVCHERPVLRIQQHKGCTTMEFEEYDAPFKFVRFERVGPLAELTGGEKNGN